MAACIVSVSMFSAWNLHEHALATPLRFDPFPINAGLNIRVADVAEHLGMTPRWAETLFKATLGETLHQHIHAVRMTAIRKMVVATDSPFSEIARRCGFHNMNHLCRLFKRTTGCTMTGLRAQTRTLATAEDPDGRKRDAAVCVSRCTMETSGPARGSARGSNRITG